MVVVLALASVLCIAAFIYWQTLKSTPQYSLALIIDAARNDDDQAIAELVDTDSVVETTVPHVIEKAVELYGRGLPDDVIDKAKIAALPLMPTIKRRARDELPDLIRRETERFGNVPFPLFVLGADRYLDIQIKGEFAIIRAKNSDRTTELAMARNGDRWRIVAVRDDKLATQIAQRIGQEIIAIAMKGGTNGQLPSIDNLIEQIKGSQK